MSKPYLKKNVLLVTALLLFPALVFALSPSDSGKPPRRARNLFYDVDRVSVAFGGGYNYAGIGASMLVYGEQNVGVFASFGHNFLGETNYALGVKFRKITGNNALLQPYVTAMYGFHGSIIVGRHHSLSRTYKGATVGFGFDQKYQRGALGYLTAGVLMTLRSGNYKEHLEYLDENSYARTSMVSPVMVTVGYHFVIK